MGKNVSKTPPPSVVQHDGRQRELSKELKRKMKAEEKLRKKKEKMAKLEVPKGPHVPKKTDENQNTNYEDEAKRRMQDQLACDSETFLLNQLMLSAQFFGCYEKEIRDAIDRNRSRENELTRQIEKHCKIVILPDGLVEALDKRVKYKTRTSCNRVKKIALQTPTQYIVHENIEITNPGEPSVYSTITDAPIYKMEIDITSEADTHVGYVRLRNTEGVSTLPDRQKSQSAIDLSRSNIEEEDDEEDDTYFSNKINSKHRDSFLVVSKHMKRSHQLYGQLNGYSSLSNSTSSLSPSNSDYDYAYSTVLNTRQPLSSIKASSVGKDSFSSTRLPDMCISTVPVASIISDESDAEMDVSYEVKHYLNSKTFLAYFLSLFHDILAADLGIPSEDLTSTYWNGAVISSPDRETIPAISCPWPNEAFEWMHRHREIKENPKTRQKFQWPTPVMVNKVVSLGCHVIPLGYLPKSDINPHRDIEWKTTFPEAERYLESCLTNAQAKIFIITRLLILTYVDPFIDSKQNTFTTEHLRTHLFWQCENNFAAWPEEYLGEALVRFLNSLLECIKRQRLPDYFLPARNLFENISEKILIELHRRIYRITENPFMHLLNALKNLAYESGFKTRINCKELYSTIVIDDPLKIINPLFRQDKPNEDEDDDDLDGSSDSDDSAKDARGTIAYFQETDKNDKSRKRRTKRVHFMEIENRKQKQDKDQGQRKDNIDIKFRIEKHMEIIRRRLIYKFFIKHFIEMSKVLSSFKSYSQSLIYLSQATRLCRLMIDDDECDEAQQFLQQIEDHRSKVEVERNRDSKTKPQLPRRESVFEPSNRNKFRSKKISRPNDQYDPYANVEPIRAPLTKSESLENGTVDLVMQKFIKSAAVSPKVNRRLRKISNKLILTNVQVHDSPTIGRSPKSVTPGGDCVFFSSATSPHSPQMPIKSVNFFSDTISIHSYNGTNTTTTPATTPKRTKQFFSDQNGTQDGRSQQLKGSILKKRVNSVRNARSLATSTSMDDLNSIASFDRKTYLRSRTISSDSLFATDL